MKRLRERQKVKRRIYSRSVQVLLLVVFLFLANSTWQIYKKNQEARNELLKAKEELALLEANSAEIVQKIKDLQSERGRDREIREKFGVAREGEDALVILRPKSIATTTAKEPTRSFWSRLWRGSLSFVGLN